MTKEKFHLQPPQMQNHLRFLVRRPVMPFSTKQIELIETLSGKITSGLDDILKACGAIYGAEEANHINTAETAKTFIGQLFHKNNDPNSSSTEQNSEGSSQRRYILSQIQGLIITLNDEICKHN